MVTPEEIALKKSEFWSCNLAAVIYRGKLHDKHLLVGPGRQANSWLDVWKVQSKQLDRLFIANFLNIQSEGNYKAGKEWTSTSCLIKSLINKTS